MRNISLSFSILVVSLFFSIQNVLACDCPALEPTEALENSKAVFIGVVDETGGLFEHHATFRVETAWKPIVSTQITVYNSKGCDPVGFIEGGRYLIYASEANGRLYTGRCNRSSLLLNPGDAEKDLNFLRTKSIEILSKPELLSTENLKIAIFIASFILICVGIGFLLNKFGYV